MWSEHNSSASRCSTCRFSVNKPVMNPLINSHIVFSVVPTVTESLYKVSTINLDIFWRSSNAKNNGQGVNLFETSSVYSEVSSSKTINLGLPAQKR